MMFFSRSDGKKVKGMPPFVAVMPFFLRRRCDSELKFKQKYFCEAWDEYIKTVDYRVTYMALIVTALVRAFHLKPVMNRFIMNGRAYQRDTVTVAFTMHRSLRGHLSETTVKIDFSGRETLREVAQKIDDTIRRTQNSSENDTDFIARLIGWAPGFLIKFIISCAMFLDKYNMLPRFAINASPFHCSFFFVNLKSLGTPYIYHHLYEFGTNGFFATMGKERKVTVVNRQNEVEVRKVMTVGYTLDERIFDGLFVTRFGKMVDRYLENPRLLEEPVE